MMMGLTVLGIGQWFRRSLLAQIAAGVIAFLGIWKLNNLSVEKKAVKKVVQASKAAGKKRNAQTAKIRSSIKPGDARKRLLSDYAGSR